MTLGPGTGQNKEEVSRNSVPGSLGLAQGGFLLSKVLQVQGSQLTMCIPASLWLTLPQACPPTRLPAVLQVLKAALSSSQIS